MGYSYCVSLGGGVGKVDLAGGNPAQVPREHGLVGAPGGAVLLGEARDVVRHVLHLVGKFPSRNENAARVEWGVSSDQDSRPLRSISA